jgi:hypothetical protein
MTAMSLPSISFARRATALLTLALAVSGPPSRAAAEPTGTWTIEHRVSRDEVQLSLRHDEGGSHHWNSSPVHLRDLVGLDSGDLEGSGETVRFQLRRDAGTFDFAGRTAKGQAGGTWSFRPDPAFAAALAQRGYERPTDREQFSLALEDVGFAYTDELSRQAYARPSTRTLVRMGQHGVNLEYLRRMGALGYRLGDAEALVRMRDHGVDPAYVAGMEARG